MRRFGIGLKLITIYLIIAIPLIFLIGLIHVRWYDARVNGISRGRLELARFVGASFTSFIHDIDQSMRFIGFDITHDKSSPAQITPFLEELKRDYPLIYVVFTDMSGTVLSSTDSSLIGRNFADHKAFSAIVRDKKVEGIEAAEHGLGPAGLHVTRAVIAEDSSTVGIIGCFVDVTRLRSVLPLEALKAGGVNLIDSSGNLVFESEYPGLLATNSHWGDYRFIRDALSGKDVIKTDFVHPGSGRFRIIAEAPIESLGWAAGSSIDLAQAIDPIRTSTINSILVALLVLLLALSVSAIIGRRIVTSLTYLTEKARAVGEGRFDEPIVLTTGDQIEDVARSLDEARLNLMRAEEKLKESATLSGMLNDINEVINSTFDFDAIIQQVLVESAKALAAESAAIILGEDDRWLAKYVYGQKIQVLAGKTYSSDEFRATSLACRTKSPFISTDAPNDDRLNQDMVAKQSIRSLLSIPLTIRGEVIGNVTFLYHSEPTTFTEAQIDFANKLGTSISLSLESARLYAVERNISNILQDALLTVPKNIASIEFGHLYRSASEAAKVGGDFYDVFELGDGKVGIVIGDVSGKGVEAATLTSLAKNTIRAYAFEGYDPAIIMSKTNNAVTEVSPLASFITVFLGILDRASGNLSYCSAGHPRPAIQRSDSEVELLDTESPIIGAFTNLDYTTDETVLRGDDVLVMYTDGVIEARCEGEIIGEEKLALFIKNLKGIRAKDFPQEIYNRILHCTDGNLSDDVAILAVSLKKDSNQLEATQ